MTTIVNGLENQKGIQFYNNEIGVGQESSGRARFLRHTNGKIYLVYAVNETLSSFTDPNTSITYTNLQTSRNLYFTYSNDGGQSWEPRVQLTTPAVLTINGDIMTWDDFPAIIQLDLTSTTSDIGVMFLRSGNIEYVVGSPNYGGSGTYRFTCNIYGGLTSPIDLVFSGGIGTDVIPMDLVAYPSGFAAILVNGTGNPVISLNPSGFTTNDWLGFNAFAGVAGAQVFYNTPITTRVTQLSNGDYACVYTAITVRNGSGLISTSRNDVYITFSQDNLQHWSAPQNVTSYSGTPLFNLSGISSAVEASIDQLTDGTISILYTEATAPECLSINTTPALNSGYGNSDDLRAGGILIDEIGGYLLFGAGPDGYDPNGIYIYRLSDGLTRNFNTGSTTNPIWSNNILGISMSTDGKYIALQTDSSIEVFNTSGGSDPLTWTLTSLRSTTTPSMHGSPSNIQFVDATHLFIGWQTSGIGRVFGSFLDCSNISAGLVDCLSDATNAIQGMPIRGYLQLITPATGDQYMVFPSNSAWYHIDITHALIGDSSKNYSTNPGLGYQGATKAVYDTINNKHITVAGSVFTDTGSGFTMTQLSIVNNQWLSAVSQMVSFPGAGCLILGTAPILGGYGNSWFYYSYTQQKLIGIVQYVRDYVYNFPLNAFSSAVAGPLNPIIDSSGNWLVYFTSGSIFAVSLLQNARLRVGNFPYNPTTPALTLTSGSFYDGVNTAKVDSEECYSILYPTHSRDGSNNIIVYGNEFAPYNGARPLSPFTGVIAANAELLSVQARIAQRVIPTTTAKAHMLVAQNRSIQVKAGLVRGRAFYAKANILPRQANTISALGVILGGRTASISGTFLVNSSSSSSVRSLFYVNGTMTAQGFSCMAVIQQSQSVKASAHFTVRRTGAGLITSNPLPIVAGNIRTMGVAAYIN